MAVSESLQGSVSLYLQVSQKDKEEAELISLWYPAKGEAELICADASVIRLSADTMALTKPGAFRAGGPGAKQLRFGLKEKSPGSLSLSELRRLSPALDDLLASERGIFIVPDRHTLVSGAVQSLLAAASLPACVRQICEDMICAYTLLSASDAAGAYISRAFPGNRHVRRALAYMQERFTEDIRTDDIARASGIHPGHLHRLFSAQAGKTLGAYLRGLRIDRAKLLLMSGRLAVEEVALAAGFSSRPYFHRVFKAETGLSPRQFRNAFNITCDYEQARRLYYTATVEEEAAT